MIAAGKTPAKEKGCAGDAETIGVWAEKWLHEYQMVDSIRDMRGSMFGRELKPKFGNQKLTDSIVERGAPITAVHL